MTKLINFPFFPFVLATLGFVLYAPSLPGEFYFDDGFFLENDAITNLRNLPVFFQGGQTISPMRGVSVTTFAVQYQIFGWQAGAFRTFNILIHILNACLVWSIVLRLQERIKKLNKETPTRKLNHTNKIIAAITSALFISHPILTSGVAYIFQRNGLLCTLFFLSAFYALINAFPLGQPVKKKWIIIACGAYLMSTWSKETGITFIAIGFVFHWLFRPRAEALDWQQWFFPLGGICLFSLSMAFWQMVKTPISKRIIYGDWTIWQNILTQWNVVMEYISLVVWPHPNRLNLDRDFAIVSSLYDKGSWFSGLILAILLCFGFWIRKKNRMMSLGVLWFFIALSVESTIIPISEVMVEYRLYLPAFGFTIVLVQALKSLAERVDSPKILSMGGIIFLVIFSVFTFQRNGVMEKAFLVWQDAAQKSPENIRAQTAYATFLKKSGRREEAIAIYRKAALLNEMKRPFKLPMPQPHNELGVFLMERGKYEKAREQFVQALQIDRWFAASLENLKAVIEKFDSSDYENTYLKTFTEIDHFPYGHYNLGNFYMLNHQYRKAIEQYEIAIFQKPNFHDAYSNMGICYAELKREGKARLLFEHSLELKPDFKTARDNLETLDRMNAKIN